MHNCRNVTFTWTPLTATPRVLASLLSQTVALPSPTGLGNARRPILGPRFTATVPEERESGRCGQRRPGKRHISYVTCQDIPGYPSLFGTCVEGGAWERGYGSGRNRSICDCDL